MNKRQIASRARTSERWHMMMQTTPAALFAPVRAGLAAVEVRLREAVAGQHPSLAAATACLLNAGGKRIRPAIVLLIAGAFSGADERSVALAAAVEMLHTATLVHDDLIDESLLRRGAPTLSANWSPNAVVLTGDYLFARAAHLGAQTDNVQVMTLFAQTLMTIVNGEIGQMFSPQHISHDEYYRRIYAKTAALFVLAAEAAAILAGADDASLAATREYGRSLGMAFQIVDDVLDFVGDPAKMGKPAGSDLRQGLITLPAICYIDAHHENPDVQMLLSQEYESCTVIPRLVMDVRESDAIPQARRRAREFATHAQLALEMLPDSVYTAALYALADYIVTRSG
jgi:geranylgeranyl pyrophosphate synthase